MYKIDEIKMLRLGQRDENLARELPMDASEWLELYPGASIQILFRRPGESTITPMVSTLVDGVLTWQIHDFEVGKTGVGNAEIRAVDTAGLRRKSRIIPCSIEDTLLGDDETVLYTQDQVDITLAHIGEAAQAAIAAKASEDAAALSAQEAADAAGSIGTAVEDTREYKEAAEQAAQNARTAQEGAEAAESDVHADAEAAEQAKVAAQAAQAGAQGAASQASAARAAAETAQADAEAAAVHAEAVVEGIDQAGAEQVAAVNAAGTTQVNAVQAKGTQVIASIPADYSALTDEVTDLKSAVAQKINEPITEGSDGQVLVTDGNGGRYWATVTSPTDSSLSIAGRAADAKATGDEITSLKSAVAEKASAIVSSVTRYYHNSLTSNDTTIVGNSFSRDEVKLNLGKSYVQAMRDNYAPSGLTISARDGRFSIISGTISANLASLYIQTAADGYIDTNAIKGKKVRVVTRSNIAVAAGGYGGYVPQISIRNNSTHLKRQNCNTSDIFNNEFTVDIPADAEKLNVIFLYLESGLNLTGVEIFLGVYLESDTVISTGKTVSDGETLAVTLPQGTTEFDSMDHASNQTAVIDTKTYVDNIVPDDVLLEADLKYLSPEMFGAVGDGVTNDAAALQACINAAIQRSLPVRGYGNYRCGAGINIVSDYGDYYLHKIEISAGAYVVKMAGTFNRLRIDNVRSYGITGAAGFVLETDATHNCESNDIWLGACTANGHAIQFTNIYGDSGKFIYYNRVYVQRLLSQTGDAIHMESNGYGCMNQNSFWAKHAHCNNGYAVYSVGGSIANRVYEICCEHYTKNVAYGSCTLINPLVADRMNDKTVGGDRGRLFVVENEYPSISMTGTLADWLSVDVSGAWSFEDARDYVVERLNAGDSHGQAFYKAFSTMKMGQPVVCSVERPWNENGVSSFKSRHCPPGKIFVYFNHKGYIPDVPWRNEITTNTYTPVVTDGRIPTIFEIGANTSIYLDDSYCCIGIKDVTIVQKDGNKAVVYGKDYDAANPSASIIFDGTNQADGTYVLHCTMTPFSMTVTGGGVVHEYEADAFEGLYVGTNDAWTVEKLNMIT